jgi:hypothetical protein
VCCSLCFKPGRIFPKHVFMGRFNTLNKNGNQFITLVNGFDEFLIRRPQIISSMNQFQAYQRLTKLLEPYFHLMDKILT